MSTLRIRAKWLFPGDGRVLNDFCVDVRDGVVVGLAETDQGVTHDLGDAALMPAFVNAHTHLEFSGLRSPLEPRRDFAGWIREVVRYRRSRVIPVSDIIPDGLNECAAGGVSAVGEIATYDDVDWPTTYPTDIQVVRFRELLGLQDEAVAGQMDVARRFLLQATPDRGLSPHAPYSVHPKLLLGLVDLARERQVPLAMHLGESPAEMELLDSGTGPLVELLRDFGVWREGIYRPGTRPLDLLKILSTAPRVLIVHGNYLGEEEINYLAGRPQFSVVYCPRTQAAMHADDYPLIKLLDAGINVAIGTDSRASNPDLAMLEELKCVKSRFPAVDGHQLLRMGSQAGAEGLGIDGGQVGIQPGAPAKMVAVSLGVLESQSPADALFSQDCQMTFHLNGTM